MRGGQRRENPEVGVKNQPTWQSINPVNYLKGVRDFSVGSA